MKTIKIVDLNPIGSDACRIVVERKGKRWVRSDERTAAEAYTCEDCGAEGFGAWNCGVCGEHNLVRL